MNTHTIGNLKAGELQYDPTLAMSLVNDISDVEVVEKFFERERARVLEAEAEESVVLSSDS